MIENDILLDEMKRQVENELKKIQTWLDDPMIIKLSAMIDYHFGWDSDAAGGSGKRIRPIVTLLCCHASGGIWEKALPAAAAIETIHNFSLVHDDIQDQSEIRRGRPTLWQQWGTAQSINTGDAIFVLAHLLLNDNLVRVTSAEVALKVSRILDRACLELTFGQHLDLAFENRTSISVNEYKRMITGKTASLLAAACEIGAVIAESEPDPRRCFHQFGLHLGIAFQLLDDILGIWGDAEKTGKPSGDDIRHRKKSLPVVLGLNESQVFSTLWLKEALTQNDLDRMILALEESAIKEQVIEAAEEHTHQALQFLKDSRSSKTGFFLLQELAFQLLGRNK
jgi:geranylgeranyl diphosphate synthase, type I